MTIQLVEPTMIFRVPLSVYTVPTGYEARALYVHARKTKAGTWNELMLEAQNSGCRLPTSAEWYQARSALENTEAEKDFLEGPPEWTGTVLDYDKGELLEGITLGPGGEIESARRLGAAQGIILPTKNGYIENMPAEYTSLVAHLWGVEPKVLPGYTYLRVEPTGIRPVVRGYWGWLRHDDRRVNADADRGVADRGFAARFVSDSRPKDTEIIEFE
jgi:hypothetical protein